MGHDAYHLMRIDETNTLTPIPCLYLILIKSYTGCVIIFDAFLVRSPARAVIGSQTIDGRRRDPRQPSHMAGGE